MKLNQTSPFMLFLVAALIAAAGWWAIGRSSGTTSQLDGYFLIFDDEAIMQSAIPR